MSVLGDVQGAGEPFTLRRLFEQMGTDVDALLDAPLGDGRRRLEVGQGVLVRAHVFEEIPWVGVELELRVVK